MSDKTPMPDAPTAETDAVIYMMDGIEPVVSAHFARRLERDRNYYHGRVSYLLGKWSSAVDSHAKTLADAFQYQQERDEARAQRDKAWEQLGFLDGDAVQVTNRDLMLQRNEARAESSRLRKALERIEQGCSDDISDLARFASSEAILGSVAAYRDIAKEALAAVRGETKEESK